ncbi:MAG: tRNA uridine-5-carboxymethylaminomethyl(34) synthesis enzyme MnmG, partial [Phycisphaerales bacterium]|nr:tRNA uridine-5-carboxymethylaminomethyl(34) synthesis enzyme MnmG [Phycisphaerales bacterium]
MRYEVVVIGGGHAGIEAAWAAANALSSCDGRVLMVTMDPDRIGTMSCNPAIGGLAKGQIVREIDALGGLMGRIADATGIMFKVLNSSRGAAVRGPRCQNDKYAYCAEARRLLLAHPRIDVLAGTVAEFVMHEGELAGVVLPPGPDRSEPMVVDTRCAVLTTGTFMRALMHTGERKTEGGRVGEQSAVGIAGTLAGLGFELGRLKTGTPPRLRRGSIDWEGLDPQVGDSEPLPFSDLTDREAFPAMPQVECRITSTTAKVHDLIRANLHRAPMYSGEVDAEFGPRYCPSIEDKVVRFAERDEHHVFLEPESLETDEIYCNGISTSLPEDVQYEIVRGMPGCEKAEILRQGYAVEYDMVRPHQIDATCETKLLRGLYLAGQINGTSGYEEAAGQGLIAGLNAALRVLKEPPVRLGRDQAYLGVMMDDLVTCTPREPYRMFTSRAEHRLRLRADTADERLTDLGRSYGLVGDEQWEGWQARQAQLRSIHDDLVTIRVEGRSLAELSRRPETRASDLMVHLGAVEPHLVDRVMNDLRYESFVKRQDAEIKRQRQAELATIPEDLDPQGVSGLRREAAEVLVRFRPRTMGQASRLAGVNP